MDEPDARTDSLGSLTVMTESPTPAAAPRLVVEDDRPRRTRTQPDAYVLRAAWFIPFTITVTALIAAAMWFSIPHPPWGLIGVIGGSLLGLMMTLAAMAWAVAIVFADDTRKGLWFVLFPPYMVVYAVRRWSWMAQPAVLFLCGLVLALGVPLAVRSALLAQAAK
jgi:hypothetical protein